jgi:hypothetical protein
MTDHLTPTPRALALEEDAKLRSLMHRVEDQIATVQEIHDRSTTLERRGYKASLEMLTGCLAALRELARVRETIAKAEAWLKDNPFSDIEADGDAIDCRTHVLVASGPTLLAALAALPQSTNDNA